MPPCLQGQHRPSGQVRVTWRVDAPDSTTMLTPRRSSSLAASTQLRCLHDDFDAALRAWLVGHPRLEEVFIPKGACWLQPAGGLVADLPPARPGRADVRRPG